MSESEVLSIPNDRGPNGFSKRLHNRRGAGVAPKAPAIWNPVDVVDGQGNESRGVLGGYPIGFIRWAVNILNARHHEILHLCSGGLPVGVGRLRVDIRPKMSPDVVADCRALPFSDGSFRAVMVDPPYTEEYSEQLYGTGYPRPSHLLREAARVVEPNGRIGMLHFLFANPPPGCSIVGVRGVTMGCGYRIRAFTVYEKGQPELKFDGAADADQAPEASA